METTAKKIKIKMETAAEKLDLELYSYINDIYIEDFLRTHTFIRDYVSAGIIKHGKGFYEKVFSLTTENKEVMKNDFIKNAEKYVFYVFGYDFGGEIIYAITIYDNYGLNRWSYSYWRDCYINWKALERDKKINEILD